MKKLSIILILLMLSTLRLDRLTAEVNYTQWEPESVAGLINKARKDEQMILLVVTQPDWCPPCIKMENAIIKNPDETEFSDMAKSWVSLEILGYDEYGAAFLKDQGIGFHGTPTTMLLDPARIMDTTKSKKAKLTDLNLKLGDLKVVHSVAGFPEDFTAQFQKAAGGYDLVAEAQKAMREEQSIESYEKLADAYVAQGDVKQANRVYRSLFFRKDLEVEKRRELEWKQIGSVTQRVAKDHEMTLKQIKAYLNEYPDFVKDEDNFEDYAYKMSWSLAAVGKVSEAKALLRQAFVEPQDVGDIRTYLYFAFRNPHTELLEDAYKVNLQALEDFPDSEAALQASRGRLLRRMNKLEEAKEAFERAIELLPEDSDALETYQGQLDYVNSELATAKVEKPVNKV